MTKFTDQEVEALKSHFREIDEDDSGFLDQSEIAQLMRQLATPFRESVIKYIMSHVCKAEELSFEDFLSFMEEYYSFHAAMLKKTQKFKAKTKRDTETFYLLQQIDVTRFGKLDLSPITIQKAMDTRVFTPEDDAHMRNLFRKILREFDSDRDGRLSVDELPPVLQSLGFQLKAGKLTSLLKQIDSDSNGIISEDEFLQFYKEVFIEKLLSSDFTSVLQKLFNTYDTDSSGFLNGIEIKAFINEVVPAADWDDVLEILDDDSNNEIDLEELCSFASKCQKELAEVLSQDDMSVSLNSKLSIGFHLLKNLTKIQSPDITSTLQVLANSSKVFRLFHLEPTPEILRKETAGIFPFPCLTSTGLNYDLINPQLDLTQDVIEIKLLECIGISAALNQKFSYTELSTPFFKSLFRFPC